MKDFFIFIREQGIVGLAIGFILGGAVSQVVQALVNDIINPLIGYAFSGVDELSDIMIGPVAFGHFVTVVIDFIVIAAVVFFIFKRLKLDRFDAKKAT